jgi:hypothetical protein
VTLPDERYRAMMAADRLLKDLCNPNIKPRVPRAIRDEIRSVLRHWPDTYYIDQLADRCPDIITARMEPLHRMVLGWEHSEKTIDKDSAA